MNCRRCQNHIPLNEQAAYGGTLCEVCWSEAVYYDGYPTQQKQRLGPGLTAAEVVALMNYDQLLPARGKYG